MTLSEKIVHRFAAELETTADILEKIKKLDHQIKYSTSIAAKRTWTIARNNLANRYNELTGKSVSMRPGVSIPPRAPTVKITR